MRELHVCARARMTVETWSTTTGTIDRPMVHSPGSVALVAEIDRDRLVCVRQYRYPLRRWTLEVPAGTLVAGEDPVAAAARELEEETGYRAGVLRPLARIEPCPGLTDEVMHFFAAGDLTPTVATPDPGELVGPVIVRRADLVEAVHDGRLVDGKTLIALALIGVRFSAPFAAGEARPC